LRPGWKTWGWGADSSGYSNFKYFSPMEMQNMQNFEQFSNLLKSHKNNAPKKSSLPKHLTESSSKVESKYRKKNFIGIAQIFFSPYSRKPLSFSQKVSTSLYPSRHI
jgi:hypothetical protein